MKHRIRSATADVPIKLIAVVLLAVLVPSVLVTALGLVEVFQADSFVRESFRRPLSDRLELLRESLGKAWHGRLLTYETYLKGSGGLEEEGDGDRSLYLAQLCERDPAVRDVLLAGPAGLRRVDRDAPWRLVQHSVPRALQKLHELEFSQKDISAALQEAQRLLTTVPGHEVQVELLLTAARLSDRLGAQNEALEYLRWALERYGQTSTDVGVVRAIPMLLRMAEIESKLPSKDALLMRRLPQVARALRRYERFMPPETVEFFEARLQALTPGYLSAAAYGYSRAGSRDQPGLPVEDLADILKPPRRRQGLPDRHYVYVPHARYGYLDFVGFSDEANEAMTYLQLDRDEFMREARVYCETVGLSPERVRLRLKGEVADSAGDEQHFSTAAPAPFDRYELLYLPPPGPAGFRAFGVMSLPTFTWAVIVSALTIFVGVAFTLRSVLRELQTARLKTDFVSFVTHELKTPLTAIRMYAETMLDGRVEGEADERMCIQIIDQESRRLTHLIDQILEFSRLERRQKKFQFVSCDMLDVVNDAVRIFHDHHQDQPRVVEINSAQHISNIRMDRAAMIELLLNLLSNAAKYSSTGKVIVVNLRESITEISVEVVDSGVGIRKRDQKKIFDRFYRADDFLTRDIDGTGLGLAFARYIAKVHNGDIKVASQLGGGSSFTLFLRKTHVLAE